MSIEVKLFKTKSDKVPAVGSITLGGKLVLKVLVKKGSNGLFIGSPAQLRKGRDGQPVKDKETGRDKWDDAWFPVTKEFRDELHKAVLSAYEKLGGARKPESEDIPF